MIHDKISVCLQDIAKIKEKMKGIKKDIKQSEKIINDEFLQLERAYKELRAQIKDYKEAHKQDLCNDDHYMELREMQLKAEEDLAHENAKLFEHISQLPAKPLQIKLETAQGLVNIDIQPEMRIYLNGREEKPRI